MKEEYINLIKLVFKCDESYAHKIKNSIKLDLPIQGAKPSQLFKIHEFLLTNKQSNNI